MQTDFHARSTKESNLRECSKLCDCKLYSKILLHCRGLQNPKRYMYYSYRHYN